MEHSLAWVAMLWGPLNRSPSPELLPLPPPLRNRESKLSVVDDYSFLLLSPREADWYLGQINSRQIRGKKYALFERHAKSDEKNCRKLYVVPSKCYVLPLQWSWNSAQNFLLCFFAGFFIVLLLLVLYLIIGELLLAYFVLFCLLTGCEDEWRYPCFGNLAVN